MPLEIMGRQRDKLIAFLRSGKSGTVLVACGRFFHDLQEKHSGSVLGRDGWPGTWVVLPKGLRSERFKDIFTGQRFVVEKNRRGQCMIPADRLFSHLPASMSYASKSIA